MMFDTLHSALRRYAAPAALAALAASAAMNAFAQDKISEPVRELSPIEIKRKKNPGDVPYVHFLKLQGLLQSYLPPEPRVIDPLLRLAFVGVHGPARDEYLPETWAVAIVGETVDHSVPVRRGGYFLLPDLEQAAREKATIMFNTQTRRRYISSVWKLRVREGQVLPYAEFAKAFDEVKSVQQKISRFHLDLRDERLARFDGLKACFLETGGRIEIDSQPAEAVTEGMCQILKFDPARASAGDASIAFIGPLDIVTLNETSK